MYGMIPEHSWHRLKSVEQPMRTIWAYIEVLGSMYLAFPLIGSDIRSYVLKATGIELSSARLEEHLKLLKGPLKVIRYRNDAPVHCDLYSTRRARPAEPVISMGKMLMSLGLPKVHPIQGHYAQPVPQLKMILKRKSKTTEKIRTVFPDLAHDELRTFLKGRSGTRLGNKWFQNQLKKRRLKKGKGDAWGGVILNGIGGKFKLK